MCGNKFVFSQLICLAMVMPAVFAECDFDDFPTMDGMELTTIMENATHNGQPMWIKSFKTDDSLESVLHFYHRKWKDAYADSELGPWNQITHLNDDCMMMVQAGEIVLGQTNGRLNIFNPPKSVSGGMGEGELLPPDGKVITDDVSRDGRKKGRTLLVGSSMKVEEAAAFYRQELKNRGWANQIDREITGDVVLSFRRGIDEYHVVVREGTEGSVILINNVDN